MKQTKIISAFPGMGKTTLYNNAHNRSSLVILDSDSSNFSWLKNGTIKNPDFPNNYIKHIKSNIGIADVILVSSDKVVRDAINEDGLPYYIVYPSIQLKREFIHRYKDRGNDVNFVNMMYRNFEIFVSEIDNEIQIFQIKLKIDEPNTFLVDIVQDIFANAVKDKFNELKTK